MKAYKNARIVIGDGRIVEQGILLIDETKVIDVGEMISIPSEAEIVDAAGKTITPGIIDVHTHLGVHEEGIGQAGADFNETSDPITPFVRALDGINPDEVGFQDALRSGITTVQIMPGSANVIGGEMVTLKTKGHIVDEMLLRSPSGMKAAFGENPKRVYGSKGKVPVTRMGTAALFRDQLIKAQNYLKKRKSDPDAPRELGLEQLGKVLNGEIPFRIHAHRADDIVTVLRLAKEFQVEITIEHCTEGHKIAEYIAKHQVRVSVGPTMSTRSKVELADKGWHTLVELSKYGVPISITTDHPVVGIEYLMTSVQTAVKHGLDKSIAWQAITLNAAKHLGVEKRVGSLEKRKDADFVIWNDDPFSITAQVEQTFIEGALVYEK